MPPYCRHLCTGTVLGFNLLLCMCTADFSPDDTAVWSLEISATSQLHTQHEHPRASSTLIMNDHENLKSVLRDNFSTVIIMNLLKFCVLCWLPISLSSNTSRSYVCDCNNELNFFSSTGTQHCMKISVVVTACWHTKNLPLLYLCVKSSFWKSNCNDVYPIK